MWQCLGEWGMELMECNMSLLFVAGNGTDRRKCGSVIDGGEYIDGLQFGTVIVSGDWN